MKKPPPSLMRLGMVIHLNRSRTQGYSLVELMIVLVLSSIVMVGAYHVFDLSMSLHRRQQAIGSLTERDKLLRHLFAQPVAEAGKLVQSSLYAPTPFFSGPYDWLHEPIIINPASQILTHYLPQGMRSRLKSDSDMLLINRSENAFALTHDYMNEASISVKGAPSFRKGQWLVIGDRRYAILVQACDDGHYSRGLNQTTYTVHTFDDFPRHYFRQPYVALFDSTLYFIADTLRVNKAQEKIYALYQTSLHSKSEELLEGVNQVRFKGLGISQYGEPLHGIKIKACLSSVNSFTPKSLGSDSGFFHTFEHRMYTQSWL